MLNEATHESCNLTVQRTTEDRHHEYTNKFARDEIKDYMFKNSRRVLLMHMSWFTDRQDEKALRLRV